MDVIGKKIDELELFKKECLTDIDKKISEIENYYKGQVEAIESIQVSESEKAKLEERIEALENVKLTRMEETQKENEIKLRCAEAQLSLLYELSSKGYK